jgi:tyrosyl-tRNA synthetase
MKDNQLISTLLDRGTADVIVRKELEQKLSSGKKLRVKLGIDPTGFDLTLGHAVVLRKLKQFQDEGHQVVLIFGTFTGRIGDPTGKSQVRTALTEAEIRENMKTYKEQAGKILDISQCEIHENGTWLSPMNFEHILELAGTFTVSQMLEREMYQERIKAGKEINLVEFFYPLMQGYDSVEVHSDLELGGTDQLFNNLAGRKIQEKFGQVPQNVLTVPILVGTDGVEKMSKSLGNYVALNDSATDMFGKTMSIPDNVMLNYFELCTDVDLKIAEEKIKESPRNAKVFLAQEIVRLYHGDDAAVEALRDFEQKFVKKEVPDDILEFKLPYDSKALYAVIFEDLKFTKSGGEARRLIEQGAVTVDGEVIKDFYFGLKIEKKTPRIIKVGKRNWAKITQ